MMEMTTSATVEVQPLEVLLEASPTPSAPRDAWQKEPQPKASPTSLTPQDVALSEDALECYICCEGAERGELLRVCKCVDRFIHLECQKTLIDKMPKGGITCSACQATFSNATSKEGPPRPSKEGWLFLLIFLSALILIGLGTHQLYLFFDDSAQPRQHWTTAAFGFIFLALVLCLIIRVPWLGCPKRRDCCVRPLRVELHASAPGTATRLPRDHRQHDAAERV